MTDTQMQRARLPCRGAQTKPINESVNSKEECKLSKMKEETTKLCLPMHFKVGKTRTLYTNKMGMFQEMHDYFKKLFEPLQLFEVETY